MLKLKREVLKRLSDILQDRPDLRAKMLTTFSPTGGGIFRDLLSGLRDRQLELAEMNKNLDDKDETRKILSNVLKKRLVDFSSQTTNAMGNATIWIPEEANDEQRKKLTKAFSDLSNVAVDLAETPMKNISELENNFKELIKAREYTKEVVYDDDIVKLDVTFVDIRLSDLEAMNTSIKSNATLLKYLSESDYKAFAIKMQKELNAETVNTVFKLSAELAEISGVSDKADEAAEKLSELMEQDLIQTQSKALDHKLLPWAKNAIPHQEKAAEIMKESVGILDLAIVEYVKEKNKIEEVPEGSESRGDPSEESIMEKLQETLAAMEEEVRQPRAKKMSLGIGETLNLKLKKDWETASKEEKKEIEKKRRKMQKTKKEQEAQAKKAQRSAAEAQKIASGNREAISERLYKDVAIPWENRNEQTFDGGNNWNQLSSELKESLNQDVDSDIPDAYREAIEQYFREIADKNKDK